SHGSTEPGDTNERKNVSYPPSPSSLPPSPSPFNLPPHEPPAPPSDESASAEATEWHFDPDGNLVTAEQFYPGPTYYTEDELKAKHWHRAPEELRYESYCARPTLISPGGTFLADDPVGNAGVGIHYGTEAHLTDVVMVGGKPLLKQHQQWLHDR